MPGHISGHDHEGHVVQLYTDDDFLMDGLSRFIGGALAVGDAAVVIATESHQRKLEKRLSARGLDTVKAKRQGRYCTLDAAQTLPRFMENGTVDGARFKTIVGGLLTHARNAVDGKECRIAAFGELVALLWAEGKPQEAIRVERLWNDLAKTHSFSLLCAYPVSGFSEEGQIEPFLKICEEHSGVVPSESYAGLGSEEERLRSIAQLQQKTRVLEKELALRQSEERFRLFVEAVQDYAIFMLDPEGIITSWNIGAERLKGYKTAEILGKHFSCFYPEEDVRNGKPQWELVIAAKESRFEDEGWRLRKDGSRFWANVIITAVRNVHGELLGFAKVTRDFTERMHAYRALDKEVAERRDAQRKLHESERSLRELSLHLLRTQDEERRRIGRELHDSLGQYLAVLKMKLHSLELVSREEQGDPAVRDVAECIVLADNCIKEVRTVSYLLYPPMLEEIGLKSAIPWYLDGFSERSGIKTTFEVQSGLGRLSRDAELALFRVLQESLTNVHRHSGSCAAGVQLLAKDGRCVLVIEDQGKGIPSEYLEQAGKDWIAAPGVGLRGMNERMRQLGGELEIVSCESGTTVRAMVPMGGSRSELPV
ncbi:MAG: PAS domain S-box protein [Candidatus Sulfotelmatobacter sp.]